MLQAVSNAGRGEAGKGEERGEGTGREGDRGAREWEGKGTRGTWYKFAPRHVSSAGGVAVSVHGTISLVQPSHQPLRQGLQRGPLANTVELVTLKSLCRQTKECVKNFRYMRGICFH